MAAHKGVAEKLAAKALFINALTVGATVEAAASYAEVNRRTLYRWRSEDTVFAKSWQQAETGKAPSSTLEAEAVRRAVIGVKKPVYRGGEIVGHTTDYSDSMLMFLLKAHHPEKYDPKAVPSAQNAAPDIAGAKDALLSKFCSAVNA